MLGLLVAILVFVVLVRVLLRRGAGCAVQLVGLLILFVFGLYGLQSCVPIDNGGRGGDQQGPALLAIGDSFSSGEGAGPQWDLAADGLVHPCRRSAAAYGRLIEPTSRWARRNGLDIGRDVVHVACQGAVAAEVPLQYALLPDRDRDRVDLVTVTMGGNDVGFSRILARCLGRSGGESCLSFYRRGSADLISFAIATARNEVRSALMTMTEDLPGATILLLSYPPLFAADRADIACDFAAPTGLDFLSSSELEYLAAKNAELNGELASLVAELRADGKKIEWVPIDGPFVGHELCRTSGAGADAQQVSNQDAWLNDIRFRVSRDVLDPISFHPTRRGYDAMARCVVAHVHGRGTC